MHKDILTAEGTPNITTAIASIPVTSIQNTNLFQSDRGIVHMSKVHVSQTYSDELEKGSEVSGLLNEGMNKRVPAINVRIVDEKSKY